MCQICHNFIEKAKSLGVSEDDAMQFLWNDTPFPVGEPTTEQMNKFLNAIAEENNNARNNTSNHGTE